jgi:hypothetical protein
MNSCFIGGAFAIRVLDSGERPVEAVRHLGASHPSVSGANMTTTRRTFLMSGLAVAGIPVLGRPPRSSFEKLGIAAVGVGGKGASDIASVAVGHNVVALCDVDGSRLDAAGKKYEGATLHRDWRRMLEQQDIDAVTVSTPDHMHAPVAMAGWFAAPEVEVEADDHYLQWSNACVGVGTTVSSFDSAGPLTEIVLLGNVAYRVGREIEWDAANLRARNAPEAASLIRREYRPGWAVSWVR